MHGLFSPQDTCWIWRLHRWLKSLRVNYLIDLWGLGNKDSSRKEAPKLNRQRMKSLEGVVNWFTVTFHLAAAAAAKSLQSCLTLCDPIDGSPPGSPVPGISQARTLEWVAISFSNAWKWKVKVKSLCCVQLLVTPWTAAHQVPLSMGFSRESGNLIKSGCI